MFVLDLETSVDVEKANGKTRAELLFEDDCTFMCALMTAEVTENANNIKQYYGRKNAEMACMSLQEGEYFTWNGSRFDIFFIYHLLRKNGFKKQTKIASSSSAKKQLKKGEFNYIIANGKILKITYRNNNGIVDIRDACLLFTCSLDSFIENTCPEKPKLVGTYNYEKFREFESDFSEQDKKYCVADVEGFAIGLHRITKEFEQEFGINILESLTAGSFAMKYAKTKLSEDLFPKVDFPRDFVIGGRTYCNPQHEGKIMRELTKIDANSFYPSTMALTKLPYGKCVKMVMSSKQLNKYFKLHEDEYIFAHLKEGFIEYNDMFSPIAIMDKNGNRLYPQSATHLDNVYIDDNIIRDKKTWHEGIFDVYIFKSKVGIFEYMRDLFNLKNKYKFEKKFALELAVKIILNATYGKFIQKPLVKEQDFFEGIIEETGRIKDIKAWYLYPPMGAAITANCRFILTDFMNQLQEQFIYSDTDSLIFYGKCPDKIPLGIVLGEWKIENDKIGKWTYDNGYIGEYVKEDGVFFARKTYAMTKKKKNNIVITFCGISKAFGTVGKKGRGTCCGVGFDSVANGMRSKKSRFYTAMAAVTRHCLRNRRSEQ
jgi:hypothetical protein